MKVYNNKTQHEIKLKVSPIASSREALETLFNKNI